MDKDYDRELTEQIDALLGKPPRTGENTEDRNVPVLTEIFVAPAWKPAEEAQFAPSMSAQIAPQAPRSSSLLKQLSEQEIDALSNDIFTRVLNRLDQSIAAKLEERLAAQLSTQINSAITHVISDMRQDIANEIGDAVNAALADKLRQP
jgi:hypothetical protein